MQPVTIEIFITLAVVCVQLFFFYSTFERIRELKNIFPEIGLDGNSIELKETGKGIVEQIKVAPNFVSDSFVDVIDSINKYLSRNKGAADFSIIKSIVERKIEAKENIVASNISLPLYIGLMGTFVGIITGLFSIAFTNPSYHRVMAGETLESISILENVSVDDLKAMNNDLRDISSDKDLSKLISLPLVETSEAGISNKKNIESFIGGVLIAMVASFFGLLFTVVNNAYNFKNAKVICDERKNSFFNFLQIELLPYLENSLYTALDRLKTNINQFNDKFESNLQIFGEQFSGNIKSLGESVRSLSFNISTVVENTNTQKEFLTQLKLLGYNRLAEANIKVFTLIRDTLPTLLTFIKKQEDLNQSVERTSQFTGTIENIFNRISTFEQSINRLGENISGNEYLGNEVLKRIDENLRYLDRQFELLKIHEVNSSQKINEFFEQQYDKIKELTEKIKREVETALDFNIENNPLQKLLLIDALEKHLGAINEKINFSSQFKEIGDDLNSTKGEIKDIRQSLAAAIEENRKRTSSPHVTILKSGEQENKNRGEGRTNGKTSKTFLQRFISYFKLNSGRKA